jgi:hypothetical protein
VIHVIESSRTRHLHTFRGGGSFIDALAFGPDFQKSTISLLLYIVHRHGAKKQLQNVQDYSVQWFMSEVSVDVLRLPKNVKLPTTTTADGNCNFAPHGLRKSGHYASDCSTQVKTGLDIVD